MSGSSGSLALAYCIDANYPMPLAVSLRSVLEHWRGAAELAVYLVHSPLAPGVRERVEASLPATPARRLHWVEVAPTRVAGLAFGLHFSAANYFRLLLPELLPVALDHVLYLDADTLALADLHPLLSLADPELPLQACQDYTGTFGNPLVQLAHPERYGVPADAPYFNSGVLLMNLRRWREERLAERVLEFGRAHPEALFLVDQTAINLVLHGRIGRLPPEWNVQTVHPNVLNGTWNVSYVPQDTSRARLLHYTSEWKPWSLGRELPEASHFHAVRARTAWAGEI